MTRIRKASWWVWAAVSLTAGCKLNPTPPLFEALAADKTGIEFVNELSYTEALNTYTYRNFYNGGGVGIGDLNNDGLADVFFCGNLVGNKLYLNKGSFRFEDITDRAGVRCEGVWTSGVAMADVNGDGWLDIYLCKSGPPGGNRRYNELFINNGDLTFTESAKQYGLAEEGLSTHAAFFDYDRDGDLDVYVLSNSIRSVGGYDLIKDQRLQRDPQGGNKLFRNDGGKFTDVSEQAGIYGSSIGFGLGVTIGDLNGDGWQDMYVSNDYFERDYLYINNQNGTFSEQLEAQMPEISLSAMGADMADLNNDGFPEVFVTDMLPETEARLKTKTTFEGWDKYEQNVLNGYHRQFTRNSLQLNNANGTFSEIGRMMGVHATDWSWGALIFDFNNDRRQDIFVANGIFKDLTDQDYIQFMSDPAAVRQLMRTEKQAIVKMIDGIPSQPLPNCAFVNQPAADGYGFRFENQAVALGLGQPSFSNGSAYADLDNDGDLDLVVNNVNMPAFVYRNRSTDRLPEHRWLTVAFKGNTPNTKGLGTQVFIKHRGELLYQELAPMRGFESCVHDRLHFGLGDWQTVDSLIAFWQNGTVTVCTNLQANQHLVLDQKEAIAAPNILRPNRLKKTVSSFENIAAGLGVDYQHRENEHKDFDRQRLLYEMRSNLGPKIAVGDANQDHRADFYVGGAHGSAGALFLQLPDGKFLKQENAVFEKDKASEDTDAVFFDADGDGDQDLYVASGGSELPSASTALLDRLYFNDGQGNFSRSPQLFPTAKAFESTSCVRPFDYDGDGDQDLWVGIRERTYQYGLDANAYLLQNNGKGVFENITAQAAPELTQLGMITDMAWLDADGDGSAEMVIVGDWMPVTVFKQSKGVFKKVATIADSEGFWNCLKTADLDADGDLDLVLGNHGWNSRIKATAAAPADLYVYDFDQNGTPEPLVCTYNEGESYPLALRHDLVRQLPSLKKKYLRYEAYQHQTAADIFGEALLAKALHKQARQTATAIALNDGKGNWTLKPLPQQAQLAPVYGIATLDLNADKHLDLVLGGNFSRAKPEVGSYMASYGLVMYGDGKGNFEPIGAARSGLVLRGEVRDLELLPHAKGTLLLVANNNAALEVISLPPASVVSK